jgi:preprotein translocase subunit SecE
VGAGPRADLNAAPDPIEHASPDTELAEAQLALGRGEPVLGQEQAAVSGAEPTTVPVPSNVPGVQPEAVTVQRDPASAPDPEWEATEPAPDEHLPAQRAQHGNRLANFVQGSWRELQRVQWPDRRQVMQATGVVIGFVIVAGVFLGVTDFLAGKVMNYILTGNFK